MTGGCEVPENRITSFKQNIFYKIGRILLPCRRRFHKTLSFEALLERVEGIGKNVEVRDAGRKGKGVFATMFIPKGHNLGKYRGSIMTPEQLLARYPDNNSPYAFQIHPGLFIDSNKDDEDLGITNYTRYINHSKLASNVSHSWRPSVMYPDGAVIFEASRDIQPGEELLFDYGDGYWHGRDAPIEDRVDCEAGPTAAPAGGAASAPERPVSYQDVAPCEEDGPQVEAATDDESRMEQPLLRS
eukprot:TRINITY_DN19649_c0_g1_i1.p1 TRINITY_DN19649_c0_g1~~TRINITY_DN19649_c0_g1_i1.p1  ORF type:complete len:267 (+),score=28.27 TRINITY_DN19649_c0_g1_i1:73-801(+)